VKKSEYVGLNEISHSFDLDIKDGLFSTKEYAENEEVAEFIGEYVKNDERLARSALGRSGYFIYCNKNLYIDCYESRHDGSCLASCANAAHADHPLMHRVTKELAVTNIHMKVTKIKNTKLYKANYIASKSIPKNVELFAHYKPLI